VDAREEYEELLRYYSMTRGADRLERDLAKLEETGLSRDEAIHSIYEKLFGQKKRAKAYRPSKKVAIILVLIAVSPAFYLLFSAISPTVSATLIYEGNWSRVSGLGLLGRNWFLKGEDCSMQFLIKNGYYRALTFDVYLEQYGGGGKIDKIANFTVNGGIFPVYKRVNFSVSTADLNVSLYQVVIHPEGTSLYIGRDPSSQYNFLTYPWLLAVIEPLPNLPANQGGVHGIPPLVVPYGLGVNIHFIAPSQRELFELGMIEQAGFRFIRMDFCWGCTEGEKGIYDFSAYQALTAALKAHRIRPLYILDYGNSLYGSDPGGMPTLSQLINYSRAYADWASNASVVFKGYGVIWEIWNEPNGNSWGESGGVNGYSTLATYALKALSKENATVVAPALAGISSADFGWLSSFLADLNSSGTLGLLTAVSVHPYRPTPPETAISDYSAVRSMGVKDLIESEWGYTIGGSESPLTSVLGQADYYARIYLTNLYSKVPVTILYDWRDDGWDLANSEDDYGIIASPSMGSYFSKYFPGQNLTYLFIKPSYYSVYTTVRVLQGLSPKRAVNFSDGVYELILKGSNRQVIAIWSDSPVPSPVTYGSAPVPVTLDLGVASVTGINAFGQVERLYSSSGVFEVGAGPTPLYLMINSTQYRWVAIRLIRRKFLAYVRVK